tara:strand:- start:5448 stop:13094 length:7647 start_codon:yes stop_codon:yes gene_type:complete
MPLQKNLNVAPYYADYNPLSDYYKVLFKAGFPVQARELTNMQLMLQNQIETIASRTMKEGDQIVPGEFGYAQSSYVRLSSITQGATAEDFIGYTLTGAVSGVKAFVNYATAETTEDDITFYVNYESSGTTAVDATFTEGETLESDTPNKYTANVGVTTISKPITSNAMGKGSLFTVKEGYYFIDGSSVRNSEQTITLDKYGTKPNYSVGFLVAETFIDSEEAPALLDNSQGSSNFAAPGADRLKVTLTLTKREIDSTNPNFIQLSVVIQGQLQGSPDQRTKWSWLYDVLAKRTFDESGDYIVTEFPVELLEYANGTTFNGVFDINANQTYPPIPGSGLTANLTKSQADATFALKISPGEAYVQGYEVGFRNPIYLYGDKPRTLNFRNDANTQMTAGQSVALTNMNSVPDFQNIDSTIDTLGLETIRLYRNFTDGNVGEALQTDAQGFVEPFNIGNAPPTTYHVITASTIGVVSESGVTAVYKGTNSAVVTSATDVIRGSSVGGATVVYSKKIVPSPSGLITPRYLNPDQIVTNPQDNPGTLGYNSTFDLGILGAEYFVELILVQDDNSVNYTTNWIVGDLVSGESTASFGVVEEGSTPGELILSNVTGEFAPGEDITQGDKVSKIAVEGEIYEFAFTDLGTEGNVSSLIAETSIKVQAVNAEINITKDVDYTYNATTNTLAPTAAGRIKLNNFPYPAGSSLGERVNYSLETSPAGIKGFADIVTAKVVSDISKTKSFYSPQPNQPVDFSADISIQNAADSDIVNLAEGSLFSGNAGNNYIVCDDFAGDPSRQLQFGDVVTFVDDTGVSVSKLVYFATRPVGYGANRDKSYVYFSTTIERAISGKTVQRIRIKKKGQPNQTLVFELPQRTVASLQNDILATGINYTVIQEFVISVAGGANSIVLNTNKQNETFITNTGKTTITVASLPSDPNDVQGILGRNLSIASFSTGSDGRQITFTLDKTLGTTTVLKVLVPVYVSDGVAKIKTFNGDQNLTISAEDLTPDIISLGKADVSSVTSIKMQPNNLEIRDNYIFDNGQRDNVYAISRLIRKPGAPVATGQLSITYDYFSHSGDGDFFSVDSYTGDGGVGYAEVPVFVPNKLVFAGSQRSSAVYLELRDCIDFRPIVNTTGTSPTIIPTNTPGRDATSATNFRDAGAYDGNAVVPRMPMVDSNFQCDMSYYMSRIDSLFIERTGALKMVQGVSANNPIPPADLATGIRLYDMIFPPYTFSLKGVDIVKYNYKRFTMSDIAGVESRIDRLEEIVTLSILEQSALNMQVRDAVTGLNRFKNGIVVDRFADHAQGAVGQEQYRNSMDPVWSHLRSAHFTDQIQLVEDNQTAAQRTGDGYRKSGPLLMVDWQSQRFMQNPFATRFINLQPFTVFTFDGQMVLTPSVDTFQDITRVPDLVIEDNNLFNAMVNLTGEMADSGIGTVWGDWENTGNTQTTQGNRRRIAGDQATLGNAMNTLSIMGINVAQGNLNQGGQDLLANGGVPPLEIFDTTTSVEQARQQTKTTINVATGSIQRTSYGDRVVDVQLARTMRSIPVRVQAGRLKPNTRYYVFFDEIEVSAWVTPDTIQTDFPDGLSRYVGQPGTTQKGFGVNLLSDDIGNFSGLFLIPNGRPPVVDSTFTTMNDVQYQTSGDTRSFNTGNRKLKITSSPTNERDLDLVEGFAEADFVSSGVLLDKQETIVSTRLPSFSSTTEVTATQSRWQESTETGAEYFDPVAQSFLIDNFNPEGLFATELEVFFKTKDAVEGVEAYLTSTDGQVPTDQIIPFSRVVKNSDSTLRVVCRFATGQSTSAFAAGITVTGQTSGATGVIKSAIAFESASVNTTKNVNNTTYNVLLDNYNGDFVEGEIIIPSVTPADPNTYTTATDTYVVDSVYITTLGSGYHSPTVTFSTPQLPGGVTATGTVKVGPNSALAGGDIIYEVVITDRGSGYTQVPSVTFTDVITESNATDGWSLGSGTIGSVSVSEGTKAIDMGVATSEDATAATKFKFVAPVYLLGDTNYAFVLKAPTSLNYNVWTSKLGENEIGTETRVVQQPNLGSLFKSQNGGLWTEDQTQDIKFVLYRAEFQTNSAGQIKLNNQSLEGAKTVVDPIETNTDGVDETSTLFGDNPKIIRVLMDYHGLESNDMVSITGVTGNPGGVPNEEFNTVHTVLDSGLRYFTIQVTTSAINSEKGGGNGVRCTPNRPYEVLNVYTGAMVFGSSTILATNTPTQAAGVSGYNVLNQYRQDQPNPIKLMDSYYYNGAKQVANAINEAKYRGSLYLKGQRSMEVQLTLGTLNSKVSPVIDLDRTNANVVRNLIDSPVGDDPSQGVVSGTLTLKNPAAAIALAAKSSLAFTNTVDSTAYGVTVKSYNATTGKITVQGKNIRKLAAAKFTDTTIESVGIGSFTTTDGRLFIPETSPDGSAYSKWISRLFLFENNCDGIELKLAACYYDKTSIRVYYRPRPIGFEGNITQENWTPFNPTQVLNVTDIEGNITSMNYPGLPDNINAIQVRDSTNVDPRELQPDAWRSLTFSVQDIPAFDALQVKIVMTQPNPALAPLVDDMQLIVSE